MSKDKEVMSPIFSMRLGEKYLWEINFDGCVGIIVLAAITGLCVLPGVCTAIFKVIDIALGK